MEQRCVDGLMERKETLIKKSKQSTRHLLFGFFGLLSVGSHCHDFSWLLHMHLSTRAMCSVLYPHLARWSPTRRRPLSNLHTIKHYPPKPTSLCPKPSRDPCPPNHHLGSPSFQGTRRKRSQTARDSDSTTCGLALVTKLVAPSLVAYSTMATAPPLEWSRFPWCCPA